jgi:hypothetical protein
LSVVSPRQTESQPSIPADSREPAPRRYSPTTLILTGLLFAACLAAVGLELRSDASRHDFISYWSSGRLAVERHNPYDPGAIFGLEKAAGSDVTRPFVMRNPPWALPLVYVLGWFSVPIAGTLWTIAILVAAVLSMHLLRDPGGPKISLNLWFFAPILLCVAAGQTATFLLLGFACFLVWGERRPFLAGCALILPALKPHLFLLFWPVWLLDCALRRDLRALLGLLAASAVAVGCALAIDPHIFSHYLGMMASEHAQDQFLPNVACALRLLHPAARWLEALPTVVALPIVLAWRWRAHAWNWRIAGAWLLAASVFTAPYSWPTDQALFLPALLLLWPRSSAAARVTFTILNLSILVLAWHDQNLSSRAYLWTSPAWILWGAWVFSRPSAAAPPAQASC